LDRQEAIEFLLDHYQNPRNHGPLTPVDVTMPGGNPGCGDIVTIYLKVKIGKSEAVPRAEYFDLRDRIDTVRSRGRREKFEAPEDAAEQVAEDPRDAIEAQLELNRMMAAMQRLPEEQREVVALILIEGFGYRETAEMLGLPIGTVSSRLVRGRGALLEMMGI